MTSSLQVHAEADAIVVSIPLKVRTRSSQGRRLMVAGGDKPSRIVARHEHATILKALGRAYRWKRMLESGQFASITDMAIAEKINHSYIRRILRLTLLSPAITEAILSGRHPRDLQLENVLKPFPDHWEEQADRSGRIPARHLP